MSCRRPCQPTTWARGACGSRATVAVAIAIATLGTVVMARAVPSPIRFATPVAVASFQPAERRLDPDVLRVLTEQWGERLSSLSPTAPRAYFELAEEINDVRAVGPGAAGNPLASAQRTIVRRLFALAGRLDPSLTAAAARAIADITEDRRDRRRLQVVAELIEGDQVLQGRAPRIEGVPTGRGADASPALLRAVSSAIASYRRGDGEAALAELAKFPESSLATIFEPWPGAMRGFTDDCRRRPAAPTVRRLLVELSAERRMLEGDGADWSAIVRAGGGDPLEEVDVSDLDRLFDVDPTRPWWRNGIWVAADGREPSSDL